MADYVPTVANVLASGLARTTTGTAGAAITAGQALCQDVDGTMKLYDANAASPLNVLKGIALHASLTNQPITYVTEDPQFTPGFALAAGDSVIGSQNPGFLCPDADKLSGWYVTQCGVGIGGNKMNFKILASGIVR
jgi:hypothetical protein